MPYMVSSYMNYEYVVVKMRKLLCIILLGLAPLLPACSDEDTAIPSAPAGPTVEELEARVIENTYIVRDALEEFRAHNDGACPIDIYADTNDLGLTLIDLLPEGQLLENPFTGERTEPVDTIATEPGQTGYYIRHRLVPFCYYINGIGEHLTIIELSNREELEQQVITNCIIVHEAVEVWASLNGGIYPANVGVDTTPEGYTVIDLLPDGLLLRNPFTGVRTEPIDGWAAIPGQIGYYPISQNLIYTGCMITACGALQGRTILTWSYYSGYACLIILDETIYCTD